MKRLLLKKTLNRDIVAINALSIDESWRGCSEKGIGVLMIFAKIYANYTNFEQAWPLMIMRYNDSSCSSVIEMAELINFKSTFI